MKRFVSKSAIHCKVFNIGTILNKKTVAGDIGIEVEVEGNKFPIPEGMHGAHQPVSSGFKYWSYVHDGSLRGQANAEYVLSKPIKFNEVSLAVDTLWDAFKKHGSILDDSNRTSVHVHLNVQEFHLNRLAAFAGLFFAFEDILTEWCGDHRVGNLFCLRAIDAPGIVTELKRFIKKDGNWSIDDNFHYAGFNANALMKFGSIEIRTLRGCTDPQIIKEWVSILQRLYDLSAEFPDPRAVCANFSGEGALSFFDTVFRDLAPIVRRDITMNDDDIRESLYQGIRFAQDLCYCRDWSLFQGIEIKPDPFGRDTKKLAKKIMSTSIGMTGMASSQPVVYDEPEPDYDDGDHYEPNPSIPQGQFAVYQAIATTAPPMFDTPSPAVWSVTNPFASGD